MTDEELKALVAENSAAIRALRASAQESSERWQESRQETERLWQESERRRQESEQQRQESERWWQESRQETERLWQEIRDLRQESGDTPGAQASYDEALAAIDRADVNDDVKDNFRRAWLYRQARVAIEKPDLGVAAELIDRYADAVARRNIPGEVRNLHELQGLQALAAGDAAAAVRQLEQANQQDPRVLYELALAYRLAGATESARASARTAAEWNQLGINYAYVRKPARRLLAEL